MNRKAFEIRDIYPETALLLTSKAMKMAGSDTMSSSYAFSLRIAGNAKHALFQYKEAINLLQRAISIAEFIKDSTTLSACHNNLYLIYCDIGKTQIAKKHLYTSLEIDFALKDTIGIIYNLMNLADLTFVEGDLQQAVKINERAAALSLKSKENVLTGDIYNNIGTLYLNLNQPELSIKYLLKSIQLYESEKAVQYIPYPLGNMAFAMLSLQRYDEAMSFINKSIYILQNVNDYAGLVNSLTIKARIYQALKQFDIADSLFFVAMKMAMEQGNTRLMAEGFQTQADFYLEMGDTIKAIQLYQNSLEFARDMNYISVIIPVLEKISVLFAATNNYQKAYHYLSELYSLKTTNNVKNQHKPIILQTETKHATPKQQQLLRYACIFLFLLLSIVSIFTVIIYFKYKKIAHLNKEESD